MYREAERQISGRGDEMEKDMLERLYRRHTKAVYLYLYSLCHNHALAEDLMQETFLRAFCSLELSGDEILPWLLTVARNLYLDTWRREKRAASQDMSEEQERAKRTGPENTGNEILEVMLEREQNQKLYHAIQKLNNTEKEAIVLYYFAGLSQEKIGDILRLSHGNTRVVLYRAKKKLKKILEEI